MGRYIIISIFCLALISTSASAVDEKSGESVVAHGGGLVCFSITPPQVGEWSCDRLCTRKDAVCVGLKTNGAMNPGIGCGDAVEPKLHGGYVASCRCCAVEHR